MIEPSLAAPAPRVRGAGVEPCIRLIPGLETGSRAQVVYVITNDEIMHVAVASLA